jgi:hypothetical protein
LAWLTPESIRRISEIHLTALLNCSPSGSMLNVLTSVSIISWLRALASPFIFKPFQKFANSILISAMRCFYLKLLPQAHGLLIRSKSVKYSRKSSTLPYIRFDDSAYDYELRCLLTNLVISNIETCFFPSNTVKRFSSALIFLLLFASWRLCFFIFPRAFWLFLFWEAGRSLLFLLTPRSAS